MTALEHLEEIKKECLEHEDCSTCRDYNDRCCVWAIAFNSAPYEWNLKALEGVLYGY